MLSGDLFSGATATTVVFSGWPWWVVRVGLLGDQERKVLGGIFGVGWFDSFPCGGGEVLWDLVIYNLGGYI